MLSSVGILLAGGRSQRFGSDKTRLVLNGETLVARHRRQLGTSVTRIVVVVSTANAGPISAEFARDSAVSVVVQQGHGAESAILTGLADIGDADLAVIACVNDLVPDRDHATVIGATDADISVLAAIAERPFVGGRVEVAEDFVVRAIVERPPTGCRPGDLINVFVHVHRGADRIASLTALLAAGVPYEAAVTRLIAGGALCKAVVAREWFPVKTPDDWQRACQAYARSGEGGDPARGD